MCGIAGVAWTAAAAPLDANVLARMTTAIAHRGPDDAGYYHSAISPDRAARTIPELNSLGKHPLAVLRPGAALGHRRLSIIDLSGGHQPLSNEDGTIWITFN